MLTIAISSYYRFPHVELLRLCDELQHDIGLVTVMSHAIPTHTLVMVALRFYATGSFQSVVGDVTGLRQSSVCRLIDKVTTALYRKARLIEIKMPRGLAAITYKKRKFHRIRGFPNVMGIM